jgi:hypothetical protein
MTSPRAIKGLTLQAVNLLEMSYLSSRPDASRSSTPRPAPSEGLALQHLEFITFCKSPKVTNALALANLVSWFALERKMPTLLVTTTCSPVLFAFNLLLWRAGIHPREVANLPWTRTHFARLTIAAGEVAKAPLLVMSSTTFAISWRAVLTLAGNKRNCRVITDAGTEAIPQLKKLSRRFGPPITIVSSTRCPSQGP